MSISRLLLTGFSLFFLPPNARAQVAKKPVGDYVDPFIGTVKQGSVVVGPSLPFGMVKPGPDLLSPSAC